MTAANRQQLVTRLHKALRSQYKQVATDTSRPILEQVLFACCLENTPYDVAQKAFARLGEGFFDLNEVRVTTVAELAESLDTLPDAPHAALSLRRVLQSVFESSYSFSLEGMRKQSLANALKTLEGLHGIPPFVVAHVASTGLGGHFIPVDLGALQALYLSCVITREEYDAGKPNGLERLVPKKIGPEFASLLHQFGVEVLRNLHGNTVRRVLQTVNPAGLKDRFPKRGEAMPRPVPPPLTGKDGQRAAEAARTAAEEHRPAGPQAAARPAGKTPLPPPGSGPKRTADGKPVAGAKPGPKPFVVKPNVGRPPPPDLPPLPPPPPEATRPVADTKTTAKAPAKAPPKVAPGAKPAAAAGSARDKGPAKPASSKPTGSPSKVQGQGSKPADKKGAKPGAKPPAVAGGLKGTRPGAAAAKPSGKKPVAKPTPASGAIARRKPR